MDRFQSALKVLCCVLLASAAVSSANSPSSRGAAEKPAIPTGTFLESQLTPNDKLAAILTARAASSPYAEHRVIGRSVQGRSLDALFLSLDDSVGADPAKPLVLIYAQQHGDETSGAQAALLLARDLASRTPPAGLTTLDSLDVILIPRVNPDGAEVLQRRNANDVDLNRNHLILSEPETRALHDLFRRYQPEVALDVHEYDGLGDEWTRKGFVRDAHVMIGAISNPNIDPRLLAEAKSWIAPLDTAIEASGVRFAEYVVGSPSIGDRFRYSTTDISDGRNSLGLYNTLSFIQEGKQYGGPEGHLPVRVAAQYTAMKAFLRHTAARRGRIMQQVWAARAALEQHPLRSYPAAALSYDYYENPEDNKVTLPVFDLHSWREAERTLPNMHRLVRVKRSLPRPEGYVLEPGGDSDRLAAILDRHGIRYQRLDKAARLDVEAVTIAHVTPMEEEELVAPNVDIRRERESRRFPAGSLLIPIRQPAALLLPLMLEAPSTRGLLVESAAGGEAFTQWLSEGAAFPVFRLLTSHVGVDSPGRAR